MEKIKKKFGEWLPIFLLHIVVAIIFVIITGVVVSTGEPKPAWEGEPVYETRSITKSFGRSITSSYINTWLRWDTGYFLKIAALGYDGDDGSLAFPPLYPFIIRALHKLTNGDFITIGLVVSFIFCLVTLVLLYETAKMEFRDSYQSQLSVIFFITFPGAFYLFAAYPESMFLTFLLSAWILTRKKKWILAGILASMAVLTRFQGITLVFPILWFWIQENAIIIPKEKGNPSATRANHALSSSIRTTLFRLVDKSILAPLLPLATLLAYLIWLMFQYDASMFSAYQSAWENPLSNPWVGFSALVTRISYGNLILMDWINLATFAICLFSSLYSIRIIDSPLVIYTHITLILTAWISFGISASDVYEGQILVSFLRYSLSLFPLFILGGTIYRKKVFTALIVCPFLTVQILLLWLFLQWYWVA